MSANCPYCGTKKVSKTFNFDEYACEMCESDFKLTESGIRIFREGSWSSLCLKSLQEMANRVSGASVTDILSRTLKAAAKQSPNDIDVVIESLTSIAATLHSEWKMGLRQVNDFAVVMEGIKVFERAALTLKKRESELNLKIRIDEAWSMGEDAIDQVNVDPVDIGEDPVTTLTPPAGVPADGEIEEADVPDPAAEDAPADPAAGGDSELDKLLSEPDAGAEDPAAPVEEPAAEEPAVEEPVVGDMGSSQDKINDLIVKASELTAALASLKSEGSVEPVEPVEAPEVDVAPEEPAIEEPAEDAAPEEEIAPEGEPEAAPAEGDSEVDDVLNSSYSHMGKHIYADILGEAAKKKKNMNKPTTRGETTKGSYRRKIDNREADKSDTFQTDMDAEEKEEKIPFTEAPADEIDNKTNSEGLGSVKGAPKIKDKDMQKESRDGFNGYRVGDEVILEKSSDTWKIAEIDRNIFTLVRGKTATVVDTFKESIRHADTRLEWQRTNELVKESSKRWSDVEKNYTTTNEACVGGMCGLGGGNRLGGEKVGMGNMLLSPMTAIATQGNVKSSVAPKSSIYKFIKDNDLHRCQREVAIPRLSEAFTNPIEEMAQILDDAVLSESEGQAENIDGIYEYKCAPIGEHARKDAFSKGWQQVNESEEKPAPKKAVPLAGVGYYRTKENDIIDRLGRTAAERLLGE
jgi:hypothetical protein